MILEDVAEEIAVRLRTIPGLRVYVGPPDSVTAPAGVIALPNTVDFDQSYGRGSDRITWPILILVKPTDRLAMKQMGQYCNGTGTVSIKRVLEASPAYASCDSLRVVKVDLDMVDWQGTNFQGALFELDVFGQGT